MPFTPFHMGPGILIKSVLRGAFSLMVFGWAQILMDIQPLIVILTGEGHLHGFSHTFLGASLIAVFAALSGKYLSELGLLILRIQEGKTVVIAWWVSVISAVIGCWSHVLLDAVMHLDVAPFSPFSQTNMLWNIISVETLHRMCLVSGLVGAIVYYSLLLFKKLRGV